jgi:hypothetical protein
VRISRAIQIGDELLVIQQHALLTEALWHKVVAVSRSYLYFLYLPITRGLVAGDATCPRLMDI